MKATKVIMVIAALLIVGFVIMLIVSKNTSSKQFQNANNVTIVDGKQIIEIHAKAGYQPRQSFAKSGIPTIIRFDTAGTFDCSASVRIPSMNISKVFPQTGTTDIDLGIPKSGVLHGTCGMGMYPFEIDFQN